MDRITFNNKSYLVVGGASGVGAGIVKFLLSKDVSKIYVADYLMPQYTDDIRVHFIKIDLSCDDVEILGNLPINGLFITAGIGRLNYFKDFTLTEIKKTFNINTIAICQIMRLYYEKMMSNDDFYSLVMCSIAGLVSSPLYALYSASKAALVKFIEALNTELEENKSLNRILAVSPGRIRGTAFHGDKNDFSLINPFVEDIFEHLQKRETSYIPDWEKTFKNVVERYHTDCNKFSLESMQYKLKNNTLETSNIKIGYLSGTFDLFHVGHLNLLRRARACCDYLIVGVHDSGAWKGKETFIPLEERKAIVGACKYVDKVIDAPNEDNEVWQIYKYDMLFVGSDYKGSERFNRYEDYFKDKSVKIVYFDYTKGTSSTKLRKALSSISENISNKL